MAKKKDIATEAVEEARKMQASVMSAAQETLAEALTPAIKKVVTESVAEKMDETLASGDDQPTGYDEDGESKRPGENLPATGDTGDNLSDEGDGPAVVEAGLDEFTEDDDEYSDEDDDLDVGDDDESEDELECFEADDFEDDDEEIEENEDEDEDDDDDDDIIEVVEDSIDEDEDEDEDDANESTIANLKKENRKLRKENARYGKAVGFLRDKIQEVNLFNTRLRAATKLFSNVSLTTEEKNRVIDRLDECESVKEVGRTYKVVKEAYSNASRRPSKNRTRRPNTKSVRSALDSINENTSNRFEELSGIKEVF
jgi:hypothetical protein